MAINKTLAIAVVFLVAVAGAFFFISSEFETASTTTSASTTIQRTTTVTQQTPTTTSYVMPTPRNYPAVHTPPSLWIELHPNGTAPAPRREHSSVYDAANDILIVFGGRNYSQTFNDTWLLAGASGVTGKSSWIRLSTSGTAPQRYAMLAGYNFVENTLIIFGGVDQDNHIQMDLWLLSNANGLGKGAPTWRRLTVSGTPPTTRGLMRGAYDEARDTFMFFGGGGWQGSEGTLYSDTWIITNVTKNPAWRKLDPSGTPPISRVRHSTVYDATANLMIVFGGNPSTSSPQSPSERMDDTWILTNVEGASGTPAWSQLNVVERPPARDGHTAVIDEVSGRMVVFGGAGADRFVRNDVWILTGVGGKASLWNEYETGTPRPKARTAHSAVYTGQAKNRMIVFGGDAGNSNLLNDVWILKIANGVPEKVPSKVTIAGASSSLYQGYSLQLTAVAVDESGSEVEGLLYDWSSSNPNVATVSSRGLVKGVGQGEAIITVRAVGFNLSSQFKVTVVAATTTSTIATTTLPTTTTITTTTTSRPSYGPLTGVWEGTFHIISTSRVKDEKGTWIEYGSTEITGSLHVEIQQGGEWPPLELRQFLNTPPENLQDSGIRGEVRLYDVHEQILFNYAPLDYIGSTIVNNTSGWIAGTASPDGSLEFTEFWTYGHFTANSAGDVINANFEQTFTSELDVIIILKLPGQKSRTVTGPSETVDVVSFSVRRVEPLPWWLATPTPTQIP